MKLGPDDVLLLVLVILGWTYYSQGTAFSSDPLLWGAAALFYVPFLILGTLANTALAIILVPLGALVFFKYKTFLHDSMGEACYVLIFIGLIAVFGEMLW